MTQPTLTPTRFENGLWQGHVQAEHEPKIEVRYLDEVLDGVSLSPNGDGWTLSVQVPATALSDGVHCFIIVDVASTRKLADFTVISGVPAADDLRSEVELLRAELDLLKRAFRRICHDRD